MKYTYYGHSCFTVEISGKHILFDPFITPNPLASEIKIAEVKADYIFVSHAHYDHFCCAHRFVFDEAKLGYRKAPVIRWHTRSDGLLLYTLFLVQRLLAIWKAYMNRQFKMRRKTRNASIWR